MLKSQTFRSDKDLCDFVNQNEVEIVQICTISGAISNMVLFYREIDKLV